jgi:hypothetical protein
MTPCSRVLPEKLIVTQLVKISPSCMEQEVSLPSANYPYLMAGEYSPHLPALFPQDAKVGHKHTFDFNIYSKFGIQILKSNKQDINQLAFFSGSTDVFTCVCVCVCIIHAHMYDLHS